MKSYIKFDNLNYKKNIDSIAITDISATNFCHYIASLFAVKNIKVAILDINKNIEEISNSTIEKSYLDVINHGVKFKEILIHIDNNITLIPIVYDEAFHLFFDDLISNITETNAFDIVFINLELAGTPFSHTILRNEYDVIQVKVNGSETIIYSYIPITKDNIKPTISTIESISNRDILFTKLENTEFSYLDPRSKLDISHVTHTIHELLIDEKILVVKIIANSPSNALRYARKYFGNDGLLVQVEELRDKYEITIHVLLNRSH
ncbi:MAG: hypothetical protein WC667_13055 [Sulfurimonas sp.]|jgi:hypothetical protein